MAISHILPVDRQHPEPEVLRAALNALSRGEPVIVPTETVYGLACRPDVPGAVERIYEVKGRPESKPLPRMVASTEQVRALVTEWPDHAERLATRYWPGPLTLVLRVKEGTLAFRIPDHPVLLELLRLSPHPLAVTSANLSGGADPTTAREAVDGLRGQVPLALDAGPVHFAVPSTIVDVTGTEPRILRQGAIAESDLFPS